MFICFLGAAVLSLQNPDHCLNTVLEASAMSMENQNEEKKRQDLEALIDKTAESMDFQGTILAARADEILFEKAYGMADQENGVENTVQTVYAVGSVSKQFTAAAILRLAEEGRINLSETIDAYFPEYEDGKKITVKHLLNMQSGIERDFWNMAYEQYCYDSMEQADEFQMQEHDPQELMKLVCGSELQFQPGSEYQYSNVNYYLLQRIAEQVSGVPFQDYISEQFFIPCGMETAVMDFQEPLAAGYYDKERMSENASLYEGCGTVCASVTDLYKWNLCLHGGKVLSGASYRVMTDAGPGNYGCGILVEESLIWHNGQLNGYNSYNCYDSEDGLMLIVLSNSRTYQFHGQTVDFPAEMLAKVVWKKLREL